MLQHRGMYPCRVVGTSRSVPTHGFWALGYWCRPGMRIHTAMHPTPFHSFPSRMHLQSPLPETPPRRVLTCGTGT